jgi:TM2 domain-containing membrane protein YozV
MSSVESQIPAAASATRFCRTCGNAIHPEAEICTKCGVRQIPAVTDTGGGSDKKILPAFLFAFFLGTLGAHRFYVGKVGTGVIMLLISITIIGLIVTAIWSLIDWIMIIAGKFQDKEGRRLTSWT